MSASERGLPGSIEELQARLAAHAYLVDEGLGAALWLALVLDKPLLLEGAPGVGKTEAGRCLALLLDRPLIRLQCYEGIDAGQALYDWDYARQLLHLRVVQESGQSPAAVETELYTPAFLIERPLLKALRQPEGCVVLIDEVDRADDEFEAFLLEFLSEFQITIPEIGTIAAARPPHVVLTSNRTRELHDALKRRCLFHWIDYPDPAREAEIIRVRCPDVPERLARGVVEAVGRLRELDLLKRPGIAESIDWARALAALGVETLGRAEIERTLGVALKEREDLERARAQAAALAG